LAKFIKNLIKIAKTVHKMLLLEKNFAGPKLAHDLFCRSPWAADKHGPWPPFLSARCSARRSTAQPHSAHGPTYRKPPGLPSRRIRSDGRSLPSLEENGQTACPYETLAAFSPFAPSVYVPRPWRRPPSSQRRPAPAGAPPAMATRTAAAAFLVPLSFPSLSHP
jgi:hypothetical protein